MSIAEQKREPQRVRQRDMKRLREKIDSKDQFMGAPNVVKVREGTREPETWMLDRAALKEFLYKRFPRANEHCAACTENGGCSGLEGVLCEHHDFRCTCRACVQFYRAALWSYVIQQCFRVGVSAETAAVDWNTDHQEEIAVFGQSPLRADYVRRVIQQIDLARRGLRLDGKPRSQGKPGRPRRGKLTPLLSTI